MPRRLVRDKWKGKECAKAQPERPHSTIHGRGWLRGPPQLVLSHVGLYGKLVGHVLEHKASRIMCSMPYFSPLLVVLGPVLASQGPRVGPTFGSYRSETRSFRNQPWTTWGAQTYVRHVSETSSSCFQPPCGPKSTQNWVVLGPTDTQKCQKFVNTLVRNDFLRK